MGSSNSKIYSNLIRDPKNKELAKKEFKRRDKNKDGGLSKDEWAKVAENFIKKLHEQAQKSVSYSPYFTENFFVLKFKLKSQNFFFKAKEVSSSKRDIKRIQALDLKPSQIKHFIDETFCLADVDGNKKIS